MNFDRRELPRGLQGYVKAIALDERVREETAAPVSELEIQARFFSGELGVRWRSTEGHDIELLDPGFWNREPGPDFIGVTIRIDGSKKIRGDIELDFEALDWERHGHATNPAFSQVALHVFLRPSSRVSFTRTLEHRNVPQVQLASANGEAFPRIVRADSVPIEQALPLIDLACRFRFHEKSQRLRRAAILHGWAAALDQAFARALGYKRNSTPFLLLAQRCKLTRNESRDSEARLFGTAGFLRAEKFEHTPPTARNYLRQLWDDWWALREEGSRLILPLDAWSFAGIRPGNHPHRRVGALLAARRDLAHWSNAFQRGDESKLTQILGGLRHPFWESHWNLEGAPLSAPAQTALVGKERLLDFLINLFHPWMLSEEQLSWETFQKIRLPARPAKIAATAAWLSPELTTDHLRLAWVQQGLLQLDADVRGWKSPVEFAECLHR